MTKNKAIEKLVIYMWPFPHNEDQYNEAEGIIDYLEQIEVIASNKFDIEQIKNADGATHLTFKEKA